MPARHRPGQAHHRRDRPADPPRPPARRRADHQRPPRLLPALVPVAAPPPGPRPMAPLRHPPHRSQHLTKDDRKEVTERNRKPEPVTSQYATRRTRTAKPRLYYKRAREWLRGVRERAPRLFAHWELRYRS